MQARPPTAEYRTWMVDSRRWGQPTVAPRDIVIAACRTGTTSMQPIVSSLVSPTRGLGR